MVVKAIVYGESCAMFSDGWHEPPSYFGSRQRDSRLVDDCPSLNTEMTEYLQSLRMISLWKQLFLIFINNIYTSVNLQFIVVTSFFF